MRLYLWRRSAKANWTIRGTDQDGNEVSESTRTSNKAVAEALRVKRETQMLKEVVHGKKAVVTFDQAVESYLDNGGSPRFIGQFDEKKQDWNGLMRYLDGVELLKITQADLNSYAKKLYPGVKNDTLNRQFWTPFIAVWRHAVVMEWAEPKMWLRPKNPKGTNVEDIGPKRAGSFPVEYQHAWDFIKHMSPANQIIMTILFYTGMRPIELFVMDVKQVNPTARWITIPKSKIGEARGIPMHEVLVPMMQDLVKNRTGKLVRTWEDEPFTVYDDNGGQMKKALENARLRCGIFDVAPYTGRHTCSTQLVVNGIHQFIKDQILGHSSDEMSRRYTHVPQPKLIEAINTLPVIAEWADQNWMRIPVALTRVRKAPLKMAEKKKLMKTYLKQKEVSRK